MQYYIADVNVDGKAVKLVYVSYEAISTDDIAKRSVGALQRHLGGTTVVLVANDLFNKAEFVGPPWAVDFLEERSIEDFNWHLTTVE